MNLSLQEAYQEHQKGNFQIALECYEKLLKQTPKDDQLIHLHGLLLIDLKETKKGIRYLRKSIHLNPQEEQYPFNLAICYNKTGQQSLAEPYLLPLLEKKPDNAAFLFELAICYQGQGKYQLAQEAYTKSIQINPSQPEVIFNYAMFLLLLGKWKEGYQQFEKRFSSKQFNNILEHFSKPRWHGEKTNHKIILIYTEQGAGDNIQYARYFKVLKKYFNSIYVYGSPLLKCLIEPLNEIDKFISFSEEIPDYDFFIPSMSIPHVVNLDEDFFSHKLPQFFLNPRSKKNLPKTQKNIGLVWKGNAEHIHDYKRSIPLNEIAPLIQSNETLNFIDLQYSKTSDELQLLSTFPNFHSIPNSMDDFETTAYTIQQCDLVICVDTAIAHIAGSLGIPTWLMISYVPDWRWQLKSPKTGWYPSMTLFRQSSKQNWNEVVQNIQQTLRAWTHQDKNP